MDVSMLPWKHSTDIPKSVVVSGNQREVDSRVGVTCKQLLGLLLAALVIAVKIVRRWRTEGGRGM